MPLIRAQNKSSEKNTLFLKWFSSLKTRNRFLLHFSLIGAIDIILALILCSKKVKYKSLGCAVQWVRELNHLASLCG